MEMYITFKALESKIKDKFSTEHHTVGRERRLFSPAQYGQLETVFKAIIL